MKDKHGNPLPEHLNELAEKRREKSGVDSLQSAFIWKDSIEGYKFWANVWNGFDPTVTEIK